MNEIKIIRAENIELRHDDDGAQVFVVPAGFELPEGEVTIRKEGDRLVIEPSASKGKAPQTSTAIFMFIGSER